MLSPYEGSGLEAEVDGYMVEPTLAMRSTTTEETFGTLF
jgi:hypothetical protein